MPPGTLTDANLRGDDDRLRFRHLVLFIDVLEIELGRLPPQFHAVLVNGGKGGLHELRKSLIGKAEKQIYRRNAYRVLLTRARQGMVIYVPRGDSADPTRLPDELNGIADYLVRCGINPLPNDAMVT